MTKRFGPKLRDAREAYTIWLRTFLDDPTVRNPAAKRMTCRDAWSAFRAYGEERFTRADGSKTGRLANIEHAIQGVLMHCPGVAAADLTAMHLEEIRRRWVDEGLTRTTINNRVNDIRRVWRWLVARGHIAATVLEGLKTLEPLERGRRGATEGPGVQPVEEAWVSAVAAAAPPTIAAMIALHWNTGMRPGELVRIRPEEIDREGDVWRYEPGRHKNDWRGRKRTIFLGPKAQQALTPFLDREPWRPCFSPREAAEQRGVAPGRAGDEYSVMSYARAIERIAKSIDVPHWSPNQIRHTVGTAARERAGLDVAQVVLGHASVDATQVYAEANQPKAIEYARRFG